MATDRGKRTASAGDLRAALEAYGPVAFRTHVRNSPMPPSIAQARSISPGRPMSTSAAGVSLRPAVPAKAPSIALPVVAGVGLLLAAAVGGGLWWSRAHSAALEITSAAPALPLPTQPPSGVAREPTPPASAAQAAPQPSVAPAIVDPPPRSVSAARPVQTAVGSAAPRVAAPRPAGRADERGLAKDNPFK
jgi:hypothetical protein